MLNKLRDEIHENAKAHGWWDDDRGFGEIVALCHSELSEALEEYRDKKPMLYFTCNEGSEDLGCVGKCEPRDLNDCLNYEIKENCLYRSEKPEGIAVELIDCIIRILDYCGKEGIDVEEIIRIKHKYNLSRPYRHGGKVI